MMLLTLIDRTLTHLFDSPDENENSRQMQRKIEDEGRMHVSINHDLNQISTSARALIDKMKK